MKKTLFLLVAAIILTLAGCQEKRTDIKPATKGITFTGEMNYYNECYECLAEITKSGDMTVQLTSPDSVNGMCYIFKDGDVTVKFNDLEYKYELSSMPDGIVCNLLYEVFSDTFADDTAVISDKDSYYITGNTGNCKYKMFVGATGLPISIEESETGMQVSIKDIAFMK